MNTTNSKKRISKADWLSCAMEAFRQEGEPGVKIVALARELKVNKAGFYWHFKDRNDLLNQLFDLWVHEFTEVVTENTILRSLPPKERLLAAMNMIYDHNLGELDVHFNAWALKDRSIKQKVERVIAQRVKYLKEIFLQAGCKEPQAEMRAELFVCYESNEHLMFRKNKAKAKKYREMRSKLYLSGL
jgi:AcrR family transcriptional regulator